MVTEGALCFETFPVAAGVEWVQAGFFLAAFARRESSCVEWGKEINVTKLRRTNLHVYERACVCVAESYVA